MPDDPDDAFDAQALDAYSTVVTAVANAVLPSVASLAVHTRRGEGVGSASVITSDGYLLTSAHVVAGAGSAEATFTDGTTVATDVAGRDELSDLAVLKARGHVPPPVTMGRAEDLRVGQCVPYQEIWNLTGQPAAVVPWDFDGDGLPISVQLVGRPYDEATLLSLSAQIEAARPWALRRPLVS